MSNFSFLISQINSAAKHGRFFIKVPTNKFLESILTSLYRHQFISSFFVDYSSGLTTIFLRYKQGRCAFSEMKLFSSPSRMLSFTAHKIFLRSKKRFQEYFFFTTPFGIKAYTFFDFIFLKQHLSLGFLLFSVRL